MDEDIRINHVALEYRDKEKADLFFTEMLGMKKVKDYTLSEELSEAIFGLHEPVEIITYDNGIIRFEVFISSKDKIAPYLHTCIEVRSKEDFISCCRNNGIEPLIIKKEGKEILFIRDFSGNLFEIKEKA